MKTALSIKQKLLTHPITAFFVTELKKTVPPPEVACWAGSCSKAFPNPIQSMLEMTNMASMP